MIKMVRSCKIDIVVAWAAHETCAKYSAEKFRLAINIEMELGLAPGEWLETPIQ